MLAIGMLRDGQSPSKVAASLGCQRYSVERWRSAFQHQGETALRAVPIPGRPPKLSPGQLGQLVTILLRGALASGYRTDLWTTRRIADVIREAFGVSYHRDHVGRLMHGLKWSAQKPERRAVERNEEEIARWKREEWPRIKKGLRGWAPTSSSSTNRGSC
jgi:transposase